MRKRRKVLRKQQLSQGVLTHLLKMLARASVFQVHFRLPYLFPPMAAQQICLCGALQEPCLVLDPFAGTCSTGIAALATGNYFAGAEIDNDCQVGAAPCRIVLLWRTMYLDFLYVCRLLATTGFRRCPRMNTVGLCCALRQPSPKSQTR